MENTINNKEAKELYSAVLTLKNVNEAGAFFRDLCTPEEIRNMSERWQIARMVNDKIPYRKIAGKLGVSTATVSRVANWVNNGTGGYQTVLNKTTHHKPSRVSGMS